MTPLIETIRAAVAADADSDAKAAGVTACRAILAALEPAAPAPSAAASPISPTSIAAAVSALRGVPTEQLLDMAIARLRAALPAGAEAPPSSGPRFQLLPIPPPAAMRSRPQRSPDTGGAVATHVTPSYSRGSDGSGPGGDP